MMGTFNWMRITSSRRICSFPPTLISFSPREMVKSIFDEMLFVYTALSFTFLTNCAMATEGSTSLFGLGSVVGCLVSSTSTFFVPQAVRIKAQAANIRILFILY